MAKKSTKSSAPKLRFTVCHALTSIYVVLLFSVFPLFLSNYYSAARRDKFWMFLAFTLVIGVAVGIISLVNYFTRNNEHNRKLNTYYDPFTLNLTDIAFFSFAGISLISMLTSGNILHSFIGLTGNVSNGRNMGFLMIALLLICYMVISRYYYNHKSIYYIMFGGMAVVSILAILNYYYIDPLGMFDAYKNSSSYDTVVNDFTSTIGNKNYLSALICVALPFSLGMSIATDDKVMRVFAYISTGIQFATLIVATSDGGFLGCITTFIVIAIAVCQDTKKLKRFCIGIAIMMLSAKLLWLFDLIMGGNSKGYSSFSEFFIYNNAVFGILAVFIALAVMLHILDYKLNITTMPKAVLIVLLSLVGVAVAAIIFLFVYYSAIDTETKLTGFKKFFRFDKYWGTHRGYFWINAIEVFKEQNFWHMLVGTGPETFYEMFKPYFSEMSKLFNESSTNSAHNVYINYLVTQGILGLGAYLVFVGSAIVDAFKKSKVNPLSLVCLCVIVAYAVQDTVNIANPVNTPWFIVFIALSRATELKINTAPMLKAKGF